MEPRPRTSPAAVAGVKRAAPTDVPTLLPAFEPLSSPPLPRPTKRVAHESPRGTAAWSAMANSGARRMYPTPVPTSSTGLVSSPPRLPPASSPAGPAPSSPPRGGSPARTKRRAGLQRTVSTLSERAPLASVPSVELDASGEPTLFGRSGKSATYQLSSNKLISRVHVRARYLPADHKVELACEGWNGVKIHCQGQAWELSKGDTFTSSHEADIMLDVQDARVLLQWPHAPTKAHTPASSDSGPEDENTPSRGGAAMVRRRATLPSPLRPRPAARLRSPISPTPGGALGPSAVLSPRGTAGSAAPQIQIYEDEDADEDPADAIALTQGPTQSTVRLTQAGTEDDDDDASDADEENDPLVHSFTAAGANLLSRMAGVTAASPVSGSHADPLAASEMSTAREQARRVADSAATAPLLNHVVNQLAFSRVASTPLSTIHGALPAELTAQDPLRGNQPLTARTLQLLIDATACIGEVPRMGKDAAGKLLESEYYYIPERDLDTSRRAAVVEGLQKPGLRSCRKSHKQYYWRKPR